VADVDVTRTFDLQPATMGPLNMIEGPFTINGTTMDMDVFNITIPLGSTEIWAFTNNTMVGHPVHIHDVEFNILDRNGGPPDAWESGWKDVIYVPAQGSARAIMRFDDFVDPDMPYMYHCHMLMHEDEGMMGQFVVVDPSAVPEQEGGVPLAVWPNPNTGVLHVQLPKALFGADVRLIDAMGRTALAGMEQHPDGMATMGTEHLAPGSYLLAISDKTGQRLVREVIITH
jgi:hypothetical protein